VSFKERVRSAVNDLAALRTDDQTTPGAVMLGYLHGETVHASFMHCVLQLVGYDAARAGRIWQAGWMGMRAGTGQLPEARNKVVVAFLDSEAEWLLWVDTDMGFEPDALERLLEHADPARAPVVGGLCFALDYTDTDGMGGYRARPMPTVYDFREVGEQTGFVRIVDYPPDTFLKCAGTGSAFVVIHRTAFERVAERCGPRWYDRIPNPTNDDLISEDLSFCLRLAAVGIPVHVHTGVGTTHAKTIYVGEDSYAPPRALEAVS
jgi:hypothetical protein